MLDTQGVFDVVVIGGGSAGLAACAGALASCPSASVLLLERESYFGGVLPQCVHDGFGLYMHGQSLTGPEYAQCWERRACEMGANMVSGCTVLSIAETMDEDARFSIEAIGADLGGRVRIPARCIVCATGCYERTRGMLQVPGGRPAGVFTAGSAQYMVNVANQMPGDKVVILGSGDIGLIMARRMVLEGADVRMVLGQEATGLVRNHIRCIEDFDIPFRSGWGIVGISGYGQLQGVTVAPCNPDGSLDLSRKEYIRCNVLLIACGLVPERQLLEGMDVENLPEGLFLCGNALHPHDLVDQVTQEGIGAGCAAAAKACLARDVHAASLPRDLERMLSVKVREPKGKMLDFSTRFDDGCRPLVCTVCPSGCVMKTWADGRVEGATCEKGVAYARRELVCPMRMFTGTVRIEGAVRPLLSVKTREEVPKASLVSIAQECRRANMQSPVSLGDVVVENVANTGVDLVATESLGRLEVRV